MTAVITAMTGLLLASLSYLFAKRQEREAELRRQKLEHYKEFTAALSGVITGESIPDGHWVYARACNNLNLVAPQRVLVALQAFQNEIAVSNTDRTDERHDALLSRVFLEIRRDLAITPLDNAATFSVKLRATGTRSRAAQ